MILKKILSVLLASVMLTGCGAGESSADEHIPAYPDTSSAVTGLSETSVTAAEASSAEEEISSAAEEIPDSSEAPLPEQETSGITPAMWEVTSDNGGRLVMMGSMHALKEECYPLPMRITAALESADALAVECDITEDTGAVQAEQERLMYYPAGESINDHISAEVLAPAKSFAQAFGLDLTLYERCKPWVWLTLIEARVIKQLGLDTDLGIDGKLLEIAKASGKEIIELESASFQMDLMAGFSDRISELMLSSYFPENTDRITKEFTDTYEAWKTGDFEFFRKNYSRAGQLREFEDAGFTTDSEEYKLIADYIDSMQTNRNSAMADKADLLLKEGRNVFLVAGEAHFCGEEGILSLLEAKGYEIRKI